MSKENIWRAFKELETRMLDREELGYLLEALQNLRNAIGEHLLSLGKQYGDDIDSLQQKITI